MEMLCLTLVAFGSGIWLAPLISTFYTRQALSKFMLPGISLTEKCIRIIAVFLEHGNVCADFAVA